MPFGYFALVRVKCFFLGFVEWYFRVLYYLFKFFLFISKCFCCCVFMDFVSIQLSCTWLDCYMLLLY